MTNHRRLMMVALAAIAILNFLVVPRARAQTYSDSFQGPAINSFWTLTQQFGTMTLSTDQTHSGTQSVKFTSTNGGQREMDLTHVFASPLKGDFSIYYYDFAPGQQTLYEHIALFNSVTHDQAAIGTQDFDATCYFASAYIGSTATVLGPNAGCGSFPQASTTNVLRTAGWHLFDINVAASSVTFSIDGVQVYISSGDFSFDTVSLTVSGPYWRPDTLAYFDDFSFIPSNCGCGTPGPAGPAGPQGPAGATGATGPQGPAGPQGPTGATGPQGPGGIPGPIGQQGATGPTGAQGTAGTSINWRGAWTNSASYAVNDAVSFNGSSYVGMAASTGAQPDTNASNWNLMSSAGATGAAGPQGVAGPAGATGPQGPAGPIGLQGLPGPQGPAGAAGLTGPQGPPGTTSYFTTIQNYTGSVNLSCPAGYQVVVASCTGFDAILHGQTPAPPSGSWASYLTPNLTAPTGVHCNLGGPGFQAQAQLKCSK